MECESEKIVLTPKDWARFQHYKQRRPPWIKLHRSILDDATFQRLPDASRALAPCLWLLSSEYEKGEIVALVTDVAWRLRTSPSALVSALIPLLNIGYFSCSHDASALLAACKQNVTTEERRGESETEKKVPVGTKNVDSIKQVLFGRCLTFLAKSNGKDPEKYRPMVGRWLSKHGADKTLAAFLEAERLDAVEPVAYIEKILKKSDVRVFMP